jgi:hypothetical protein
VVVYKGAAWCKRARYGPNGLGWAVTYIVYSLLHFGNGTKRCSWARSEV